MTERADRWLRRLALHTILIALAGVVALPFVWLVWASFRPADGGAATLGNYAEILLDRPFITWLVNSLFLASVHTVSVVALSSLGGFALAKYRFRGRRAAMLVMLLTMLLPSQVLLPSMYELMHAIGWIDSYLALLVPTAVSVFGVFLFRQAMLGIPDELLQAGRVDGCSELRLWWDVAMPVVRPMTAAFTLLSFLGAWNSFLWPQIIPQTPGRYHLPIGLGNMVQLPQYQTEHAGVLMAGTVIGVLPVVLLFVVLQRDFVSGLTSGAVED